MFFKLFARFFFFYRVPDWQLEVPRQNPISFGSSCWRNCWRQCTYTIPGPNIFPCRPMWTQGLTAQSHLQEARQSNSKASASQANALDTCPNIPCPCSYNKKQKHLKTQKDPSRIFSRSSSIPCNLRGRLWSYSTFCLH